MVDIRRFLHQLRPAGAPGAAAGAAVPLDRHVALEAELAPVFEALAGIEAECGTIRSAALAESARRRTEAEVYAARAVATAQAQEPARRAEAMEQRLEAARRESIGVAAQARCEAIRVAERAASMTPELVAVVVEDVRSRGPGAS